MPRSIYEHVPALSLHHCSSWRVNRVDNNGLVSGSARLSRGTSFVFSRHGPFRCRLTTQRIVQSVDRLRRIGAVEKKWFERFSDRKLNFRFDFFRFPRFPGLFRCVSRFACSRFMLTMICCWLLPSNICPYHFRSYSIQSLSFSSSTFALRILYLTSFVERGRCPALTSFRSQRFPSNLYER